MSLAFTACRKSCVLAPGWIQYISLFIILNSSHHLVSLCCCARRRDFTVQSRPLSSASSWATLSNICRPLPSWKDHPDDYNSTKIIYRQLYYQQAFATAKGCFVRSDIDCRSVITLETRPSLLLPTDIFRRRSRVYINVMFQVVFLLHSLDLYIVLLLHHYTQHTRSTRTLCCCNCPRHTWIFFFS